MSTNDKPVPDEVLVLMSVALAKLKEAQRLARRVKHPKAASVAWLAECVENVINRKE